jgi:hypothetical protein
LATANVRFPTALGLFGLLFGLLVLVLQPSCRVSDGKVGTEVEAGVPLGEYRQIPTWMGMAAIGGGALLLASAWRRR